MARRSAPPRRAADLPAATRLPSGRASGVGRWSATAREMFSRPESAEEHTSELQARLQVVCRLQREKKQTPERGGDSSGRKFLAQPGARARSAFRDRK